MVPKDAMRGRPSESELVIPLWHGGEIFLVGMDKPERIEGAPVDGGVLDEYGNMKPQAWGENVRPALSDRDGLVRPDRRAGRPQPLLRRARRRRPSSSAGPASEWGYFTGRAPTSCPPKRSIGPP
jgi:hypothetical protein